nr:MAG TPA: minor tail protein [Caudoviricetes sp.]
MAIGFSYTLKPDEAESLKELKSFMGKATELSKFALKIDQTKALEEFESFIQKIHGTEVDIKLNFGGGTGGNGGKGGTGGLAPALERQVQLVQDRLNNALNNLTLKADSKGLQGLLPVEQIIQQINQLGQSGESLRQVNLQASEIRAELQMWGQALNNDSRELAEVTNLAGQLASKVGDQKEIAKNNQELQKLIKSRQEDINAQIKQIQTSKEFKQMTAQQQTAFNDLANSMKIVAYSAEGANQQFSEFRDELVTQQRLMHDRSVDRISDAYERLGGTIQNLVLRYASLQLVLHQMKQYFQEAIEYTYELDAAYTDVAISMDISRTEFNKWTQDAMEIARANGIATTSVLDMVKIYATAGEDISAVAEKLSGTAMLQNITQWDADQTTSVINSIINQYQLLDKEINGVTGSVSNAINYLGDNLIAISNELTIDNVKGIQEMASAIDDAGSVVKNAGGSMEWYMSVTGALAESMNATGSEVGAALRMIKW